MKMLVNLTCFKGPKAKTQDIKIKHHVIYIFTTKNTMCPIT